MDDEVRVLLGVREHEHSNGLSLSTGIGIGASLIVLQYCRICIVEVICEKYMFAFEGSCRYLMSCIYKPTA